MRGSGLFVGESGVAANHHFLLPRDDTHFNFTEGTYRLDVFVKLLGDYRRKKLFSETLLISSENARRLQEEDAGLYFDWGPDSSRYLAHIDIKAERGNKSSSAELLEILTAIASKNAASPETTVIR